ncbi:MAG: fructooligosaccharide transport system permease protein [Epulopiscium sp.]|jgi:ABC-type glycerol-3-phosphate transport system permease component|uniref:ABC transporter permease subunit n=1 Tax=Defluviitalea raffinosedens TaxID=1450156 RepID=A0A7C8HDY6_9FIRM|nr:carbohydrate ABC transporter permease [Defluviitalea raffinosedens]KAE9633173.1 ABC transporter permease subunit [Defluviitalea raffinosedens]MBZ4667855.1 binding-protein-dependent transport system inner rane component [Defluviitaleaceae bacterium]MDK2787518.1 fructooligosaccharide transport system permease protein [Candidatus Epulonipiscium sp.]
MKKMKALIKSIPFYTFMFLLAFIFLFPIVWMVVNSFKPEAQIMLDLKTPAAFLPPLNISITEWFTPYKEVFMRFDLFRGIRNSLMYAIVLVALNLLVNSMGAYALAKFDFPLKNFWFTLIVLVLIVPAETNIVPLFVIVHKLGLENTLLGLLAPNIGNALNLFLFRQFFIGIPKELEEAALIDGANSWTIFYNVIMPLSKSIFATIAILTFILSWNDYIWPVLIFADNAKLPLQVILNVLNNTQPVYTNQVLAALTVATIPMVLIYAFFQQYIVEGISHTGIK